MSHPSLEPPPASTARTSLEALLPLLRCPATGAELHRDEGGYLTSVDGGRRYPVVDGVPVLICAERSLFDLGDYVDGNGRSTRHERARRGFAPAGRPRSGSALVRRLARLPPSISKNVAARDNYRELARLLESGRESRGRKALVLVIGGATVGDGIEVLAQSPSVELVETDVALGPRTQVACDAHQLPFPDGAFDAVVCQAVLSHVPDPFQVASEIHRVLTSRGLVYSETSFMQQVCEGDQDFTRWTLLGHRRLFRCFEELRSGAQCGPGMALAWSIQFFLLAFAGRSWIAHTAIRRLVSLATFWLKYLDRFLARTPGGLDAASGTYFLGRRRETPVADREIVAAFRGV
jgi:SAM-dependent methyltransferase